MRATSAFLLAAVFSACSTSLWSPPPPAPVPDEPRLGPRLTAVVPTRLTRVAVGSSAAFAWVSIWASRGFDDELLIVPPEVRAFRVAWSTGVVEALPPPPFVVDELGWGTVMGFEGALLYSRGDDECQLAWFDGTAWTALPRLPINGAQVLGVEARGPGQVVVRTAQGLASLQGGDWQRFDVADAGTGARLGPWGEQGLRVVHATDAGLCTSLVDGTSLQPLGSPGCLRDPSLAPLTDGLNGSPADFQVLAAVDGGAPSLVHVVDGLPVRGEAVAWVDTMDPAPGSAAVMLRAAQLSKLNGLPALGRGEAGRVTGLASTWQAPYLDCACNRSKDATCACITSVAYGSFWLTDLIASPDGRKLAVVSSQVADAQVRFHLRRLDLPQPQTPFTSACSADCGTQLCTAPMATNNTWHCAPSPF